MRATNTKSLLGRVLHGAAFALCVALGTSAHAAAPGISSTGSGAAAFNLTASPARISQPDGASIYMWGYGCAAGSMPTWAPATITGGFCGTMQVPGPTLVVTEGQQVSVTLTNNLPASAGNTSILFPGFQVCAGTLAAGVCTPGGGVAGLLTREAAPLGSVTYRFDTTGKAGTHAYYSGSQSDLQVEMGLYGAIIVLPAAVPTNCTANQGTGTGTLNDQAKVANTETDFRHKAAAYNHPSTCYDREYLFQFSEIDPRIHSQVEDQVTANAASLNVETEPYHPAYFMINGRSMPDDMDANYAPQYPHQPYNGNPHMHPGELTLLRIIGQGRWQHPFHEHGNHVRVLARDGNLLLAPNVVGTEAQKRLAGPLLFTTTTTPGQAMDGIFYWTGKGLNWDVFGHGYTGDASVCIPDANGYYTSNPAAPNYYEWCGDHNKALESKPFGQVGSGGPMTLPDPNIVVNGPWYSGSAYLGPDAAQRAVYSTPIPPSGTVANSVGTEAGFAYMWHSHNEREITTNNIFPGGMLMMMLIDPRAFVIDESK